MALVGITQGVHSAVFRCFEGILRRDFRLKQNIKTWMTWTGEPLDVEDPSKVQMPCIRLTPVPEGARWENDGQHDSDLVVRIELGMSGTRIDDIMDLWGAIVMALFPADRGPIQLLDQAGSYAPTIQRPAFGAVGEAPNVSLWAEGSILFKVLVSTPG